MDELERFPNSKTGRYPHMFTNDIVIWERFLEKHGQDYEYFLYDVKVGSGTDPPPHVDEPYASMQKVLSKYRIDAIGRGGGFWEVFEVKPLAATSAIGQVISYLELLVKDYEVLLPTFGAVVTDFERPDVRELTAKMKLRYYVV